MVRRFSLIFLAFVTIATGIFSQPVAAASPEPTALQNVQVWVNPEYDQPSLLIMLEGQIAGATAPATIRFLVPTSAQMYSAGSKDAQGNYTGGPPTRKPSSVAGWDEISYTLTFNTFRVEYYDPNAITGAPDKKISLDLRWLYPVSSLKVMVQQPKTATNFSVTPQGAAGIDGEGLKIQTFNYNNLPLSDTPLHWDISYTKTDSSVSNKNPPIQNPTTTGSTGSGSTNTVVIAVIGAIVVLAGATWMIVSARNSSRPKYVRRTKNDRRTGPAPKAKKAAARFCRSCGKPIQGADKFCPSCGEKLD